MAKQNSRKPGLPDSFNLNVSKPVELGDYLDNDNTGVAKIPHKKKTGYQVYSAINRETNMSGRKSISNNLSPQHTRAKERAKEPPRKQINMKPETLRKAEELLAIIRLRGPQRDTAASEMFDAIITVCYQAKDRLDLATLSKRGRWGTSTAAAFVDSLSEAISDAIAKDSI